METTVVTGMESVTGAMSTGLGFLSTILDAITSNPILVVIFAVGTFVPLGIKVFKRLKGAAK